jgi:D-inositol-3-phosphate glycosyltransferase
VKITFVSEHASPLAALGGVDAGGQNVHVAELAKALVGLGHEVSVVTRRDDPELPPDLLTADGYRVVHLSAGPPHPLPKDDLWPHMTDFGDGLLARLRAERPDLVHAHFWMSGWAAQQAATAAGLPTVVTFHALGSVKRRHQGPADTSPPERVAVETDLASSVQRIVATCTDEVTELADLTPTPAVTSVVPCGVDVARFSPTGPAWGDRHCSRRIVALGRLVPRKGFATVIEALPRLPDTELVLAGGTAGPEPERDRLLGIAAACGVESRVRMVPQVPRGEVPALLRSADVVVTTPWYEPFGIVPLEAMACGRPVVASAVGGMLDTVVPGDTGLLIPPRDVDALSAALQQLLSRPDLRRRYGRLGVERARIHYSWRSVAERTARAYALTLTRHLRTVGSVPASLIGVGGR